MEQQIIEKRLQPIMEMISTDEELLALVRKSDTTERELMKMVIGKLKNLSEALQRSLKE